VLESRSRLNVVSDAPYQLLEFEELVWHQREGGQRLEVHPDARYTETVEGDSLVEATDLDAIEVEVLQAAVGMPATYPVVVDCNKPPGGGEGTEGS